MQRREARERERTRESSSRKRTGPGVIGFEDGGVGRELRNASSL